MSVSSGAGPAFASAEAEYADFAARHGAPERIELMLCDINAVLRGKWLPSASIGKLDKGGVRLPIAAHAPAIMGYDVSGLGLGIEVGDPDGPLTPVLGSMRPVPWSGEPAAQMLVDMKDPGGGLSALSCRGILQGVADRFAARGLRPVAATELEFYVLQPRAELDEPPRPPARSPDAQNYDLEILAKHERFIRALRDAAHRQELPIDGLLAEFGQGQFEVNFHHSDDVVGAADTALLFKRLVRHVAREHALEATFMAKPYAEHPGNGMHVHLSVLDDAGRNIFDAAPAGQIATSLRHAVAGLLSSMGELQAIFAPHLNSYRRFMPGGFAPTTPDWGVDHRGASVRLPEIDGPAARLEHRFAGADANPYLALAAVLGGVLRGLDAKEEPRPPLDATGAAPAPPLCREWSVAVECFAGSALAADLFGERFRDLYAGLRRGEMAVLLREIAPVEYRYYLSRL